MKGMALFIAISGIFVLELLMLSLKAVEINDVKELDNLEINSKVVVEGKVVNERILYLGSKLIVLDNGVEIICEDSESFKGKRIRVEGLIDEFNNKKQIGALRIEISN